VWKLVISSAPVSRSISHSACSKCYKLVHDYVLSIIVKLSVDLSVLQDLSAVFEIPTCCSQATCELLESWRDQLRAEIFLISTFADIVFSCDTTASPQETFQTSEVNAGSGMTLIPEESPGSISKAGALDETNYIMHERKICYPVNMTNLCIFLNPRRHSRFSSKFLELLLILIWKRSISAFLDHFPLLQICMESIPQFRCAAYAENKPYRMILLIDPSVVMAYALEGNNYDLMNKSAPLLVGRSSVKMVELFKTPSRIASSFKYLQKWDNVVQMALSLSESRKVSQYYFEGFLRRGCDGCRSPTSDDTTLRIMPLRSRIFERGE
ncbi:hypothetical protein E4T56_gene9020, partial [Termitomyces sp. T112]